MVKPTTVRLLLSLAVSRGWSIRQLDIHNAFLNGQLAETVYMRQPPGYEDKLLHNYFLVYVDDILIMDSDSDRVTTLIDKLALELKVRDMGVPSFFLGIEIVLLSGGMLLSQQRYMKDILKRAGMVDCKPVITPVSSVKITDDVAVPYADPTQYRSLAGALQYLTVTRPDLSYDVNLLCQHMHAPTTTDWVSLKRVMRYVKGTLNLGLRISRSTSMDIHAYSDSDWADDPNDHKSTSGFAVFLGSNLISWIFRKQRTVACSSTEVEYKGLADIYMQKLHGSFLCYMKSASLLRLLLDYGDYPNPSPKAKTNTLSAARSQEPQQPAVPAANPSTCSSVEAANPASNKINFRPPQVS
ncbi:PREDICTED: uncharacterized protein LOC109191750 [Ipomoea nil]|uniref:uncharacterized protein LOC109191750 n=1 Tax=Ipomoea nil TaxID=35883 RepID=UPI000901C817|nr:PREDICTED: uncharacterized protein LOC109191750 [Ipomoea nil]